MFEQTYVRPFCRRRQVGKHHLGSWRPISMAPVKCANYLEPRETRKTRTKRQVGGQVGWLELSRGVSREASADPCGRFARIPPRPSHRAVAESPAPPPRGGRTAARG